MFSAYPIPNFNTSHVSINLKAFTKQMLKKSHFNTSHVSINHYYIKPHT